MFIAMMVSALSLITLIWLHMFGVVPTGVALAGYAAFFGLILVFNNEHKNLMKNRANVRVVENSGLDGYKYFTQKGSELD